MADTNPVGQALSKLPNRTGIRWFVKRGATTYFHSGFHTKVQADAWITEMGTLWRCGWKFQAYGDSELCSIVDKRGNEPKGSCNG